jgi:hypothetical protein
MAQDDGKVTVDPRVGQRTQRRKSGKPSGYRKGSSALNIPTEVARDEPGMDLAYHDVNHPTDYDLKTKEPITTQAAGSCTSAAS